MSDPVKGTPLAVTGMGMVTPVGDDAMSSTLAIQAGVSRLAALDEFPPQAYWDEGAEELQATGATVREKTAGLLGVNRLVALAVPALKEAVGQAQINMKESPELVLLQTVPSAKRPERDDRIEELFARRLERRCGLAGGKLNCRFVDQGHAGIIAALVQAAELLSQNRARQVVVGGVESLTEPLALHWLNQGGRLRAGTRVDGFFPGEAAAYLVVEKPEHAAQSGHAVLGFLSGMSLASEQNPIGSKRPPIGLGLAEAILGTIGSLEEQAGRIRHVIGDLNGERYRAIEWSYAEMRAFANYDAERLVWFHADCIGDTGCASGGVSLIYALASLRAGLVQAEPILVFSSADDGQRASVMVSSQLRTLSTA